MQTLILWASSETDDGGSGSPEGREHGRRRRVDGVAALGSATRVVVPRIAQAVRAHRPKLTGVHNSSSRVSMNVDPAGMRPEISRGAALVMSGPSELYDRL